MVGSYLIVIVLSERVLHESFLGVIDLHLTLANSQVGMPEIQYTGGVIHYWWWLGSGIGNSTPQDNISLSRRSLCRYLRDLEH